MDFRSFEDTKEKYSINNNNALLFICKDVFCEIIIWIRNGRYGKLNINNISSIDKSNKLNGKHYSFFLRMKSSLRVFKTNPDSIESRTLAQVCGALVISLNKSGFFMNFKAFPSQISYLSQSEQNG